MRHSVRFSLFDLAKEGVAWLGAVKPGQEGGKWPEGLDWPNKMKTHVSKALGRWQEEKQQPAAAAQ